MKIKSKIKKVYKSWLRKKYQDNLRKRFTNQDITIISQNCLGGIMYHDLGLRFSSPTVNMYFESKDFLKFLKKIEYYLNANMYLIEQSTYNFPVIMLDDIKIYAVHYKSFEEFQESWKRRVKRVNLQRLYIIMTQRDGCSEDDIAEFDSLPYKNKIIFVNKVMPDIKSSCYIEQTKNLNNRNEVTDLTRYISFFSGKRYMDYFDWVNFLNGKSEYNEKLKMEE